MIHNITSPFGTLSVKHDSRFDSLWKLNAPLPILCNWMLKHQFIHGDIEPGFNLPTRIEFHTASGMEPLLSQYAEYAKFLENKVEIEKQCDAIVKTLAGEYLHWLQETDSQEAQQLEEGVRRLGLDLIEDSGSFVQLMGLSVFRESLQGRHFVGLDFYWAWNEEHGPKVLFYDGKIIKSKIQDGFQDGDLAQFL
jgi:hypothetical protein